MQKPSTKILVTLTPSTLCMTAGLHIAILYMAFAGSHWLRALTFIVDAHDYYRWAKNMKRLRKEACKMVTEWEEKYVDEKVYKSVPPSS